MKILFVILSSLYIGNCFAQDWRLTYIESEQKVPAGVIYHTESRGTEVSGNVTKKVITGLRLACAGKDFLVKMGSEPVIAVYWNTMTGNMPQTVSVKVDGKEIELGQAKQWRQEGNLLYRPLESSRGLLQALKVGRLVSFEWVSSDSTKRQTVFDITDFRTDLSKFNDYCNIQI